MPMDLLGAELFLQGDGDRTLSMPSEGKDHRKFLKVATRSLVFIPYINIYTYIPYTIGTQNYERADCKNLRDQSTFFISVRLCIFWSVLMNVLLSF